MRELFSMDKRDYDHCTRMFVRHSARAIIIRGGRVAMVHSRKFDFYKFPGGGINEGEAPESAMIRETREETGLVVRPESVREYGIVRRRQRSETDESECFVQDNYYFLCDAEEEPVAQELDRYEKEEGYALEFIDPVQAIGKNRSAEQAPFNKTMLEREARVLEMLIGEGAFL